MNSQKTELIDSSLFLGMHSISEEIRVACKNYFIERLQSRVCISLEHVGSCDEIIWGYSRELQDAYYPFMDTLHTVMKMQKFSYQEEELRIALNDPNLKALSMYDRLLIALAKSRHKTVFTVNQKLLNQGDLPVSRPPLSAEKSFPNTLEQLYQRSLKLRIPDSQLTND